MESLVEGDEAIAKRDKALYWKVKAEASRISFCLLKHKGIKKKELVHRKMTFSAYDTTWFYDESFDILLQPCLQILFRRQTHFIGTRTLNYSIKFLSVCAKMAMVKI